MYSENLKKIRKTLRYSIDEMAKILEIPARTLGGYERKERTPSIELVTQLCKKLNINANWFVTSTGEMFNTNKDNCKENLSVSMGKAELTNFVKGILKTEGLIK